MGNAWDYESLKILVGRGRKPAFLSDLCSELFSWTRKVTEKYDQFPGGYTEWTLAGHFAIIASRNKYLPFQDALIKFPESKAKSASKRHRRPDLYIDGGGQRDKPRVFFQFKQGAAPLIKKRQETIKVLRPIRQANEQLKEIRGIADAMEWPADWGCCALGLIVSMDWKNGGNDLWQKSQYDDAWHELKERFQEVLNKSRRKFLKYRKVYYLWYRLPHSLVSKQRKWAEENNWNPLPTGMLWVFTVRKWAEI